MQAGNNYLGVRVDYPDKLAGSSEAQDGDNDDASVKPAFGLPSTLFSSNPAVTATDAISSNFFISKDNSYRWSEDGPDPSASDLVSLSFRKRGETTDLDVNGLPDVIRIVIPLRQTFGAKQRPQCRFWHEV